MGGAVGAIPSAIGGRHVTLSHVGKVFAIDAENLRRWEGWWRYVLVDQICVWAPGCFMGMALPALLSLQFAPHSPLAGAKLDWAQSLITGRRHPARAAAHGDGGEADVDRHGVRRADGDAPQPDVDRRRLQPPLDRHDLVGSRRVRDSLAGHQVGRIYYAILGTYVLWTVVATYPVQHLRHARS
jgi:hypothetical protein